MKRNLIILLLSFITTVSFSQGINFETGTFKEALAKAKKENKILFMDCYTTWCGPCLMMSKDVFPQKKVGDFFNKYFVSIKMDMEKGEGIALREAYKVVSFPTLLFIDANGKEIHKLIGGMYADDLIKGTENVVDPNKRMPMLAERYNKGNRDLDFVVNYINVLHGARENEKATEISKEFVSKTPIEKFNTAEMLQILSFAKVMYGSKEYNYILNNEEKLIPLVGSEKYFAFLDSAIKNYLYDKAENGKSIEDLEAAIIETRQKRANPYFQKRMEGDLKYAFYMSQNDLKKWMDLKLAEAESLKPSQEYIFFIHDLGTLMVNNPKFDNNKEAYDRIIKIGHEIADKGQGAIMGGFLLAKLYLKTSNKEQALKYFNIFFKGNEASGGNTTHVTVTDLKKAIDNL